MKIIDKREIKKGTFGELNIGEFFIDECDNFVIKISGEEGLCLDREDKRSFFDYDSGDSVTAIEVEIHIIG